MGAFHRAVIDKTVAHKGDVMLMDGLTVSKMKLPEVGFGPWGRVTDVVNDEGGLVILLVSGSPFGCLRCRAGNKAMSNLREVISLAEQGGQGIVENGGSETSTDGGG